MNALKAHKILTEAYEMMKKDDNELTRKAVLALMDVYNAAAKSCPEVYQKVKNAGDNNSVWIIVDNS